MRSSQLLRTTTATILLVFSAALFADMKPPKLGAKSRYECTGPYDKVYEYLVASVNGDSVRIDSTVDGKSQYVVKKYWIMPTTIADERQRNDGAGLRKHTYNAEKLKGLVKLDSGWEFKDMVREKQGNKQPFAWRYNIRVGDRKQIDHAVLGLVEIVEIIERREVIRGDYASSMVSQYAPARGMTVGWRYKDREGTQECNLVALTG